jgi:hypothetical protein
MDIQQARWTNLLKVIRQLDSRRIVGCAAQARWLDSALTPGRLASMLLGSRIDPLFAAHIEHTFHLPRRWMDRLHAGGDVPTHAPGAPFVRPWQFISRAAPATQRGGAVRAPARQRVCSRRSVSESVGYRRWLPARATSSHLPWLGASSVLGSSEPSGRCNIRYFARGLPGWVDGRNASRPGQSRVNGPDKNWVAR